MKTNPRFSARLPLFLLLLSVAGSLSSCKDPVLEASRQREESRKKAEELKKQHRAELKELNDRIASLEAEAAPPPPAADMEPELPTLYPEAAPVDPDDEKGGDSLTAQNKRKIAAYQEKGLTGVPKEISAAIVRRARRETRSWAALDEIEAQAEGYRTVQSFAKENTGMLREERDELLNAVQRQHPNDWASMAKEIHAQSDAWQTLAEWKVKGVPGLKPWESTEVLSKARELYPYDWSAAIGAVADEAKQEVTARRNSNAGK